MKQLAILILFFYSTGLWSQDIVNPVCDEALEIPYSFSYSGFILFDQSVSLVNSNFNLWIEITEGSTDGPIVYSQSYVEPFSRKGFFNLDIGKDNEERFLDFVIHLNENSEQDYFINVFYRNSSFDFVPIGSKPIQTVPYAMVANSLNGIGPRGIKGEDSTVVGANGADGGPGPSGAYGVTGATGQKGETGFHVMVKRSIQPSLGSAIRLYVDDGTNTSDGKPHLMHKPYNDIGWIEL